MTRTTGNQNILNNLDVDGATTLDQTSIDTTDGQFAITGSNNADIDVSAAISLDSTAASNFTVDGADLTLATSTSGTINVNSAADISLNPATTINANSSRIINVTDPTSDQDAATKAYVDSLSQGLYPKESVRLATAASLSANTYDNGTSGVGATLTGDANGAIGNVDGVAATLNDRLLVKDESTTANNGIYEVTQVGDGSNPYILTRVTDMDESDEIAAAFTFVEEGSTNADTGWVCTTNEPVTMGTTAITFAQFSGGGTITAGDGLTKTGSTIDVVATNTTLTVNADDVGVNVGNNFTGGLAWTGNHEFTGATHTVGTSGQISIGSSQEASTAVVIEATGTAGGIDVNSGTGGLDLDTTGPIALTSSQAAATAVVIESTDTSGGIDINSGTSGVDLDTTGQVNIDSSQAASTALRLNASDTTGGIDIDSGIGGIAIDTTGSISLDSETASNFTLSANDAGDIDLTISATNSGAGNSNIIITSDGQTTITSTESVSDAVLIRENGGTAGQVHVSALQGTGEGASASVLIDSTSGGVTIQSGSTGANSVLIETSAANGGIQVNAGTAGSGTLDLNSGTGGVDVDTTGQINLATSQSAATAVVINASDASGGIDVDSGTGGLDLDTTGQINLDSSQTAATAIVLNASDTAGGLDFNAGTGGITVDTTGVLSMDSADTTNLTMASNDASDKLLTLAATNAGAGDGILVLQSDEQRIQNGSGTTIANKVSGIVQTTDATQTTIITFATSTDEAYYANVKISARQSASSGGGTVGDSAIYQLKQGFKNISGNLSALAGTPDRVQVEDNSSWDTDITTSGTDITVTVTGIASATIEWKAWLELIPI